MATFSSHCDQEDGVTRVAGLRSEGTNTEARWDHTPFWESWQPGRGLQGGVRIGGISESGFLYVALDVPISNLRGKIIGFTIQLSRAPRTAGSKPDSRQAPLSNPSQPWIDFFESFPQFRCSDPYLERYYDYRIYGLGLNRLSGRCGHIRFPAVAEGIGYFHVPISYSAQCHMWETRWSRSPELARGSLLNFLEHQKPDGSLHGRIYTDHLQGTDFYHANWGDAALAVQAVHPDQQFLSRAYEGLGRYATWLDSTRDREQSGMYDVVNHYETGQEYMSRYQAVDPSADTHGWEGGVHLKGIDVTVYGYQLKRALATMALSLGRSAEVEEWTAGAERVGRAITETMWDAETGMFSDVRPETMDRTGVKAAVCFYPLLTDLLTDDVVRQMVGHLRNPTEFATPYPVPSSSLDDPCFNANAEWKGKRHNCPWNGRTWPMVNSHIIEGLLRQWHRGRAETGELAAHLLSTFVRMMFLGGNLEKPNCYEHYNPITGHPSRYRGIDDYQHSWVLDLLIRGVIGLEPTSNGLRINPLPLDVGEANLSRAHLSGHPVSAVRLGQQVTVTVDSARHSTQVGQPIEIVYD